MASNGRLAVDQKVKVVLFYAETKSVVATRRRFRAHFGKRWAHCKQTIYRLSLGTTFQPMRINSVPDVKCFLTIKMCYVYNQRYDISCPTLYIYIYIERQRDRTGHVQNNTDVISRHYHRPQSYSMIF